MIQMPGTIHFYSYYILHVCIIYISILIYVLMNSLDRCGLGPQVGSFSVDFSGPPWA